jgi:leucine dehydrogenase
MEEMGHEQVVHCYDPATQLRAIIAIHNTTLGPSLGGCRFWEYTSEEAALFDVLRLSRGMTYKSAVAGLPLGGGKAVLLGDVKRLKTPQLLQAFGRFVNSLGGRYITAEDVNMCVDDMIEVGKETKFVTGKPQEHGGSGDPSPYTALGIYHGICAAVQHRLGKSSLSDLHVAIQGCGSVGRNLAKLLHAQGVKLSVSDISAANAQLVADKYEARIVPIDQIHRLAVDVYAPCALGGILSSLTIPEIQAPIVAGGANNQLLEEKRDGSALKERGILWAPDFVINAGGVINVYHEWHGYDAEKVKKAVLGIGKTLSEVFLQAEKENCTPLEASMRRGDAILQRAKSA